MQAEAAIASKILSGNCSANMLKVKCFCLLIIIVFKQTMLCALTSYLVQLSEPCSLSSITSKIKRRWGQLVLNDAEDFGMDKWSLEWCLSRFWRRYIFIPSVLYLCWVEVVSDMLFFCLLQKWNPMKPLDYWFHQEKIPLLR